MVISRVEIRQMTGGIYRFASHPYARNLPLLLIGLWFVWLLAGQVQNTDLQLISMTIGDISGWQWAGSLMAMAVSFLAVATYDRVACRALDIRLKSSDTLRVGFVATALAQMVGLGLASGSLARWRMLGPKQFSLWQATLLTVIVTSGFLAAAILLTAVTALIWLSLPLIWVLAAFATIVVYAMCLVLCVFSPNLSFAGRKIPLPKLKTLMDFTLLCIADLGFAALAFWLLLPSGVNIPFFALLPIFFIATGAGVVSGVPGGVGPFEVMCLTLLPVNQPEPVLAAIFGYRLVYYFLPALLAVALLMTREWRGGDIGLGISSLNAPNFARKVPTKLAALIDVAQRADARLIHAQDFSILPNPRRSAFLLSAETGNSLLAVSDPLGPQKDWPELMMALKSEARQRNVRPLIYKCGYEAAKLAQQAGFTAHRIGHEAVLNPQKYSVKGSKMRGLRRKLRQVEKAGIRIEACDDAILPLAQMHKVSREWAGCNGKARGFSMGRFHIHNTRHHRFFLAWQGGSLIGFIGLWHTQHEMSLDLMRSKAAAPSGVMQALVHHAILEAAMQGRVRFSLASVPFLPIDRPETLVEHFCNWLYRFCPNRHCGPGLYQFKQGFRPEWKPRYLAATSLAAAALGGFDIARRIEQREYTD